MHKEFKLLDDDKSGYLYSILVARYTKRMPHNEQKLNDTIFVVDTSLNFAKVAIPKYP